MIPVGSPRSSFVEKLPSVQITRRLDQLDLAVQVVLAVLDLDRQRVAVAGGTALQNVRNEHLRARQPDLAQQLLEQLAGAPDERHPLLVLAGARRLADEHQVGVGVAGAEHDRLARRRELGAAHAALGLREHLLERLAPLGGRALAPALDIAGW